MLKTNILANVLGRGWSILMGLIFVPLYIKFLGIEAYGLIGFFVTLQGLFSVLDLGLSTTLNRELARASAHPEQAQQTRDLVRTLEVIYWGIAILIGAVVIALAPWIARHWLNAEGLSVHTVEQSIRLLGLIIAFQWPNSFYSGGLIGLQRQVLNNAITSVLATVRGAGAVLILWLISSTIEAYFRWQLVITMLGIVWLVLSVWFSLPQGNRSARFNTSLLQSVWHFAAGMTGSAIMVLLLAQTSMLILSVLLPLEKFGYYTLAGVVASASVFLAGPIFTAVFPRLSQIISLGNEKCLRDLYHKACQLVSVAVLPPVLVVAFFSFELLDIWTRNPVTAEHTHWIVSLLVIGSGLNGLMHLPYALQLAHGWTQLTFTANMIAALLLAPLTIALATHYGAIGAAVVWIILNTGYVLFGIPTMHRRLLRGEQWRWYTVDVGRPLAAALPVVALARWLLPGGISHVMTLLYLVSVSAITLIVTALAAPQIRVWLSEHFRSLCDIISKIPTSGSARL
jgi:O-antigen/teichoic acid export membrane protein